MTGEAGAPTTNPGSTAVGGRGYQVPEQLRTLVLDYPRAAIRQLHPARLADPVLLPVLRAENHLRLGQPGYARPEADRAVAAASEERPGSRGRLLLTATVFADVTCANGDPGAAAACADLYALAIGYIEHRRQVLAAVLRTVAVFHHHDCQYGRAELADLYRNQNDTRIRARLLAGLEIMDDLCTVPSVKPPRLTTRLAPVPGGLLNPDPTDWHTDYLPQRIRSHRAAHSCMSGGDHA